MPIELTEYTKFHPSRLTRQSDSPVMAGTYTLSELTALYGGDNEYEALRFAAMQGQAFFKQPKGYVAFNPIPGETSDLPLDVNSGAEVEAEVEAEGEGEAEVEAEGEVEAEVEVEAEGEAEVEAEAEAEGDTDEAIEAEADDDEEDNSVF